MASLVSGENKIVEICDVLGLRHVRKIDIHFAYGERSTIEAEFYPEIDEVKQLVPILKKFELVYIEKEKNLLDGEYGLNGPNDKKASPPANFINERDI